MQTRDVIRRSLTELLVPCMQPCVPAITAPQPDDAMEALQKRADELQVGTCPPLTMLGFTLPGEKKVIAQGPVSDPKRLD